MCIGKGTLRSFDGRGTPGRVGDAPVEKSRRARAGPVTMDGIGLAVMADTGRRHCGVRRGRLVSEGAFTHGGSVDDRGGWGQPAGGRVGNTTSPMMPRCSVVITLLVGRAVKTRVIVVKPTSPRVGRGRHRAATAAAAGGVARFLFFRHGRHLGFGPFDVHRFSYHRAGDNGTAGLRFVELSLRDGRHRGSVRLGSGCGIAGTGGRSDGDHGGLGTESLLRRDRTDDGVVAVDGGRHATARQAGRDTVAIDRRLGEPRVAKVTGHEEMLVLRSTGKWRDGRNQRPWSVWSGAICHTRNVGDLDDVGGTREDGRGNGSHRPRRLARLTEVVLFLLHLLPLLPDDEPPNEEDENGNKSKTSNDTSSNGTRIAP